MKSVKKIVDYVTVEYRILERPLNICIFCFHLIIRVFALWLITNFALVNEEVLRVSRARLTVNFPYRS